MADTKTIVVPWDDGTGDEIRFTYSGGITIWVESDDNRTKFERRKLIVFKTDFPLPDGVKENEAYLSLVQTVDNVVILQFYSLNQTFGNPNVEVDPTWVHIPALGNKPEGDDVRVLTNSPYKLS